MHWSISLACFLLIFTKHASSLNPEPRSSCSEHFLNGQFKTSVLPIKYGNDVYNLECVMPRSGINSPNLLVETTIRNAGEKLHDLFNEIRSVGYQVSNWEFLQQLIDSNKCEQELTIDWRPLSVEGTQAFKIQPISGKEQEFIGNHTTGVTQIVNLTNEGPVGIVHLIPTGNSSFTAKVTLSALRCRQSVVANKNCEFELNSAQDKISVATSSANELSFSFKTDKPHSGFIRVVSGNSHVDIRLEDGYFISLNGAKHPIRLLADGNFHGVNINFKSKTLRIDGHDSLVSFDSKSLQNGINEVLILINGSVAAIKLDQSTSLCKGSPYLTVTASSAIIRQICPIGQPSFCQCKAPLSIFKSKGSSNLEKCSLPSHDKAFTLSRDSSKLAFYYFNTSITESASVVFKSDATSGLIMFGQRKKLPSKNLGMERFQVHYVDDSIVAGACLHDGSNQWNCQACKISRPAGFATNEWIRVSFFDSGAYTYLTVDEQVCKLSRNSETFKSHEFYKAPETSSFLFVGGAFYKKPDDLHAQIKDAFKNDFYDLTNVKALSIRGCIAEIRMDGYQVDLLDRIRVQSNDILNEPKNQATLFSIKKGCQECDLPCEGACRIQAGNKICDCSEQFEGVSDDGKCGNKNDFDIWLNSTDQVSVSIPNNPGRKQVTKFWTLLRFPQINKDLAPIIEFNVFTILVGEYGTKVVIRSDMYGVNEEFEIADIQNERLHVISIEEAPSIYDPGRAYKFRVDSEVHLVKLDAPVHFQRFDITITSVKNDANSDKFSGCIQVLGYKMEFDDLKDGHKLELVNVIRKMHQSPISQNTSKLQMSIGRACGVYDPNFFVAGMPSSSLGIVGPYDPYGTRQKSTTSANGRNGNTGFWFFIILLIVGLFVLICAIALFIVSRYGRKTYNVKDNRDAKIEEVQPLYRNEVDAIQTESTFVGPANANHSPPEQLTKVTVVSTKKQNTSTLAHLAQQDDL